MRLFAVGLLALMCLMVVAKVQAAESKPHQQVERVTEKLIKTIEETRHLYDKDPNLYYRAIAELLEPMIDFPSFARGVMGEYGTREYYQSLSDAEAKAQFRQQYNEFVEVFKQGLMQTYGKGFLAFNGQKITVLKANEDELKQVESQQPVDVRQSIENGDDRYLITYKMRPDKTGQWLLRNVVIESVNVGQLYRNQFVAAMNKHERDFQVVIKHWLDESQKAEETLQEQAKH